MKKVDEDDDQSNCKTVTTHIHKRFPSYLSAKSFKGPNIVDQIVKVKIKFFPNPASEIWTQTEHKNLIKDLPPVNFQSPDFQGNKK